MLDMEGQEGMPAKIRAEYTRALELLDEKIELEHRATELVRRLRARGVRPIRLPSLMAARPVGERISARGRAQMNKHIKRLEHDLKQFEQEMEEEKKKLDQGTSARWGTRKATGGAANRAGACPPCEPCADPAAGAEIMGPDKRSMSTRRASGVPPARGRRSSHAVRPPWPEASSRRAPRDGCGGGGGSGGGSGGRDEDAVAQAQGGRGRGRLGRRRRPERARILLLPAGVVRRDGRLRQQRKGAAPPRCTSPASAGLRTNARVGRRPAACAHQCPYSWFHFPCVGLTSQPSGKWYCSECLVKKKKLLVPATSAAA